jgi:hypothetical protein
MYTHLEEQDLDITYLDSFKDIVTRDIKNESTSEEKTILQNNVDLWLYNLRVIRRDVEFQLGSNKSKNKLKALEMKEEGFSSSEIESFIIRQNQWRINTIRFLSSIEKKMLYVKMLEKTLD